jgi:hypothetical protein
LQKKVYTDAVLLLPCQITASLFYEGGKTSPRFGFPGLFVFYHGSLSLLRDNGKIDQNKRRKKLCAL